MPCDPDEASIIRHARIGMWTGLVALSALLALGGRVVGLPATFLVGPMVAAVLIGLVVPGRLRIASPIFVSVQALLGCAIARAITASFLDSLGRNGALMLLVVAVTILSGMVVGWALMRWGILPGSTAAWGSTPGGASAMVVLAGDHGADVRLVAFMQYARVVMVVLTASLVARFLLGSEEPRSSSLPPLLTEVPLVPFLKTLAVAVAAGTLGWWSRVPAGALLAPMLLGGLLHALGMDLVLPPWLLALANAILGWRVGLGFDRDVLGQVARAVPHVLVASLLLIGACALSGWFLTWFLPVDGLTAYLATSPGGLDSVAIIALGSGADLSFVMAVQTLRLFLVILLGPRIARWLCRCGRSDRGARDRPSSVDGEGGGE